VAATRTAEAVWEGSLVEGKGTARMVTSGVFGDFPVTWASRAKTPDGRTSPEELMAAAHAVCYAMAFSHFLTGRGTPPERLRVTASYTFVPGTGITEVGLDVEGSVPGVSAEEFPGLAKEGEQDCPVSNAVRGNVQINLSASLQ